MKYLFTAFLKKPLEDHVNKLPTPVIICRSDKRIGLVRARLMGAREATGNYYLFFNWQFTISIHNPVLFRRRFNIFGCSLWNYSWLARASLIPNKNESTHCCVSYYWYYQRWHVCAFAKLWTTSRRNVVESPLPMVWGFGKPNAGKFKLILNLKFYLFFISWLSYTLCVTNSLHNIFHNFSGKTWKYEYSV